MDESKAGMASAAHDGEERGYVSIFEGISEEILLSFLGFVAKSLSTIFAAKFTVTDFT